MKMRELIEHPTFTPFNKMSWESEEYLSLKQVSQFYNPLGAIILDNQLIEFFILQNKKKIIGCIKVKMSDGESKYHEIFVLVMTPFTGPLPDNIPRNQTIQTTDVSTDLNFQGRGLATFVYFGILVDLLNYVVISDEHQIFGGIKLWRRMARDAAKHQMQIHLIKNGEYVLNNEGQPLVFNDTNFPKSKIWSRLPNDRGKNVLLVLSRV